jgi:small subunit ribosomal protein S1
MRSAATSSMLLLAAPCFALLAGRPLSVRRAPPRSVLRLDATAFYKPPTPASLGLDEIVTCTVLGPAPASGYFVDIGSAKPALLPAADVCLLPNVTKKGTHSKPGQGWRELEAGDVYEGQIIGVSGDDINVSLACAQRSVAWRRVKQIEDEDVAYNATVLRVSEAGATVSVERLPAFVPWSHWHRPGETPEQLSSLIGSEIRVKFLEVDRQSKRLMASNRRVQLQERLAELAPGQVVSGTVTAIKDYGAVVRLSDDGLDGLLHISQISQGFVNNVSAILALGQEVRCVVIKVDARDGSVSLSTKRLEQRPGDMLAAAAATWSADNKEAA